MSEGVSEGVGEGVSEGAGLGGSHAPFLYEFTLSLGGGRREGSLFTESTFSSAPRKG